MAWVRERSYRPSDRHLSAKLVPTFADRVPLGQQEGVNFLIMQSGWLIRCKDGAVGWKKKVSVSISDRIKDLIFYIVCTPVLGLIIPLMWAASLLGGKAVKEWSRHFNVNHFPILTMKGAMPPTSYAPAWHGAYWSSTTLLLLPGEILVCNMV
jgi:hypothetical protein